MDQEVLGFVRLLLTRLERISADSRWSHRVSGVRGALLRELEEIETGQAGDVTNLWQLAEKGGVILKRAMQDKLNRRGE